ncbi:biosynthetic arginine decarboxylase [Piscirickettsia litoralis]|uniref:Biosynthetic arginine decarboxylase n=1 Tax=Piscirickettsia litoralis TaxID=1891921 RepID=A0ABX3A2L4_9GAMM|nr:biosynthetic arginine decarboxylase [Piscirickettsia litoralis]ODN43107.1 arginine decarboxylase [Piscirickettsia litoralis]
MAWSIKQSKELYNISEWGDGYFNIDDRGQLIVRPQGSHSKASICLDDLVNTLAKKGEKLPLLIRFTNILRHRAQQLAKAFNTAIQNCDYQGNYTPVYPIKVNQQRAVVESLLSAHKTTVGLEAGSKPELMAIIALAGKNSIIVCNGYKDRAYIRLALISQKLGNDTFIVIEKISELALILDEAKKLDITPNIGVRIRLASLGKGKWQNTGGEKAKFGLYAGQVIELINTLKKHKKLDCLRLLHCHLGSQLANIRDIQRGVNELTRIYIELKQLHAPLNYVDLGGGLGIDYEGTGSRSFCSMNYSLDEYASNIVNTFKINCNQANITEPHLITESGRALTAHHAVLVTNIIDCEKPVGTEPAPALKNQDHEILHQLADSQKNITTRNAIERFHDAAYALGEAQSMFNHGILNLQQRAQAEHLYSSICLTIKNCLNPSHRGHRELLDDLNERLADKVFCNLSIFQSLPDIWAIDQIFPIMPTSRLNEEPTRRGILQDITCDSDGTIKQYVDGFGLESSLPLPADNPGKPYNLAIFLVGAYQETLGDLHNLFGDTNAVHVEVNTDGSIEICETLKGDTIADVLSYVQFNPKNLTEAYLTKIKNSTLNETEKHQYFGELIAHFESSTYLVPDNSKS